MTMTNDGMGHLSNAIYAAIMMEVPTSEPSTARRLADGLTRRLTETDALRVQETEPSSLELITEGLRHKRIAQAYRKKLDQIEKLVSYAESDIGLVNARTLRTVLDA